MRLGALAIACTGLAGCSLGGVESTQPFEPTAKGVVWAVGDGADGSSFAKRMAARIAADRPERFLYLGDVYVAGTAREFRVNYGRTYGRLRKVTEPTSGNHDYANRRSGYLPYWRKVKGHPQPLYYSLKVAGWEILSLNSEAPHGRGSRQMAWLHKKVRAPGTCRIVFWHRPRFSAGAVHGDDPSVAPLWNALRGHARIVLTGHDHSLQRFKIRSGITEYVAGAGGRELYPNHKDSRLAFGRAGVRGGVRMKLAPGKATLEFRSSKGKLLDRSRATCRP
jgi:hypothetical protein